MRRIYPYMILLCQFVWMPALSQFLHNYGEQIISIQKDAVISVHGDVLNEGVILNNGNFSVSSHWDNNNVYNGKGAVILNGEEVQDFDNNSQDVYKLIIDGGGEKRLLTNLNLTKELSLIHGMLTPLDGVRLSLTDSVTVTDASADAYVNGALFYAGTGYKFFPVGQNGNYRPLELLDVSGIDPLLRVEVVEANPQPNTLDDSLNSLSEIRYWEVTNMAGTYHGSLVKLSVGSDEGFEDLMGVVVAESPEVGGDFVSLGRSETSGDPHEGTVTSEDISTQEILALGITSLYSEDHSILVPSAFAPDAANPEDRRLIVFGNNIVKEDFYFRIFNRWGKLVYETHSFADASTVGWEGTNKETGETAQFGVYSYVLQAKFDNGKTEKKTGTITLFR